METLNVNALEMLMDKLNHGLLYVNKDKYIMMANESAKNITGINIGITSGHDAGKIEPGDIVIIADNRLGEDDGDFTSQDFEKININDSDIKQGDMVIALGVYMNKDIEPQYKYLREHQLDRSMTIETDYYGFHIKAVIDTENKFIEIDVNNVMYRQDYFSAIGHMVVIDSITGRVKFFQAKGYSVRDEDIGTLMRGGSFRSKSTESVDTDVTGVPFLSLFDESQLSRTLFRIIDGDNEVVSDQLFEINKRPFICSIIPWKTCNSNGIDGAFLLLEDAGRLEDILQERNEILQKIEEKSRSSSRKSANYPEDAFDKFVGNSSKSKEVKYLAYKASQNKFNVIITGDSGTGKSMIAREIHRLGNPKTPFVEVNCNAIAPSLFESELFGYVGGAFTGAKPEGKIGFFQEADKGTIFLDEIGEIPLDIQVKLLHVLQSKYIYKVGSSKPIKVDVRVIAATNKDLEKEVLEGRFRQDLFYRINVFPIHIPPIKERKADLYVLINQILKGACDEYGLEQKQFSGEALQRLINYDWPGNVRELENVIERAITLCESRIIYSEHLKLGYEQPKITMKEQLEAEEKRILETTLSKYSGDKAKAMEELDISKSTFYEKLKKYEI